MERQKMKNRIFYLVALTVLVLMSSLVSAQIVAVSGGGYHPLAGKQVVVYNSTSESFVIKTSSGLEVYQGVLQQAEDNSANPINCQGGISCLVGNFSEFSDEGIYYIETQSGEISPQFRINDDVFSTDAKVFLEFFNAMKQQNSDYHASIHSHLNPSFNIMADGSFIMESYQAAIPLIRLGNAYRRNPSLFGDNKEEFQSYMLDYVNYLKGLQGLEIEERTDGVGFRLNPHVEVKEAFVPGPTDIETLKIFTPGKPPVLLKEVSVKSLCGEDDDRSAWDECINEAATYYKCQIDEPCINMTYIERTGVVVSNDEGYDISKGWGYEFGCFFDIGGVEVFSDTYNPCMIFHQETDKLYTIEALAAFTEAIPAINDYSPSEGQALFQRSVNTYEYVKDNYPTRSMDPKEAAYFGTAAFLLYDYTGDEDYLIDAYNIRSRVSVDLDSWITHSNEFYWEEYIRHKSAIENASKTYNYGGVDPAVHFQSKLSEDYLTISSAMSKNAERVFERFKDNNFQNSRAMLIEGVLAAKTKELHTNPKPYADIIANHQLYWLTGMNAVQEGVSSNSSLKSYSFIFGIGENNPQQFHSRYLINTGYSEATNQKIIGARGTGLQFFNGTEYVYLDGTSYILGQQFGALGNEYRGEEKASDYQRTKVFANGKTFISGWINGAFDTESDSDKKFNYRDNLDTYEYTETTNEMVASAVELYSFLDAQYNNKSRHAGVSFSDTNNSSNETENTPPVVTVTSPLNNIELNISAITIAVNASDSDGISIVKFFVDDELLDEDDSSPYSAIWTPQDEGTFSLKAQAIDTLGAAANSSVSVIILPQLNNETDNNETDDNETDTNHALIIDSSGSTATLFETDSRTFTVELSSPATVVWKVNNEVKNSTSGTDHSFPWTPGIRFAGTNNLEEAVVTASVEDETESWSFQVRDVINPFFEPSSGEGGTPKLHVFTYNPKAVYTSVNVTILDPAQTTRTNYALQPNSAPNSETEWKEVLSLANSGAHHLVEINLYNNSTDALTTYTFQPNEIGYTRNPAPTDGGSSGGGGGSSGGGGGGSSSGSSNGPTRLRLIYVIFENNIVKRNETQGIKLDAQAISGDVRGAEATIIAPSGTAFATQLRLISGDTSYGTWGTNMTNLAQGSYSLVNIKLFTSPTLFQQFNVTDRAFYVVDETVTTDEKLAIVYTTLSESVVENPKEVIFKLDARDSKGVESISAFVELSNGTITKYDLRRISGSKEYGTWQTSIPITVPNTSYKIIRVTLDNGDETKEYQIKDRSVYASFTAPSANAGTLTGRVIGGTWSDQLKKPYFSTIVAFTLMALIIAVVAVSIRTHNKFKERKTQNSYYKGISE